MLTHGHFDHIGAVRELMEATGAPLAVHGLDADALDRPGDAQPLFGLRRAGVRPVADVILEDGDVVRGGRRCAHASCTLRATRPARSACSRTGTSSRATRCSPGPSGARTSRAATRARSRASIREKLAALPDDTVVHPGHGGEIDDRPRTQAATSSGRGADRSPASGRSSPRRPSRGRRLPSRGAVLLLPLACLTLRDAGPDGWPRRESHAPSDPASDLARVPRDRSRSRSCSHEPLARLDSLPAQGWAVPDGAGPPSPRGEHHRGRRRRTPACSPSSSSASSARSSSLADALRAVRPPLSGIVVSRSRTLLITTTEPHPMNYRAPKGTADMLPDDAASGSTCSAPRRSSSPATAISPSTPPSSSTRRSSRAASARRPTSSARRCTPSRTAGAARSRCGPRGRRRSCAAALEHNLVPQGSGRQALLRRPDVPLRAPAGRAHASVLADRRGDPRRGRADGGRRDHRAARALLRVTRHHRHDAARQLDGRRRAAGRSTATRSRGYIREHAEELCDECDRRAETNPLRAFDCKNPTCRDVMDLAPTAARRAVRRVRGALRTRCKRYLDGLGIAYVEDPRLVRGPRLLHAHRLRDPGARARRAERDRRRRALRPADGEVRRSAHARPRLRARLRAHAASRCRRRACERARAPRSRRCTSRAWTPTVGGEVPSTLAARLREAGIAAELDHQGRSLKSQFKQADRLGARFVVVVGPDELAAGEVTLREMATSEERRAPLAEVGRRAPRAARRGLGVRRGSAAAHDLRMLLGPLVPAGHVLTRVVEEVVGRRRPHEREVAVQLRYPRLGVG